MSLIAAVTLDVALGVTRTRLSLSPLPSLQEYPQLAGSGARGREDSAISECWAGQGHKPFLKGARGYKTDASLTTAPLASIAKGTIRMSWHHQRCSGRAPHSHQHHQVVALGEQAASETTNALGGPFLQGQAGPTHAACSSSSGVCRARLRHHGTEVCVLRL